MLEWRVHLARRQPGRAVLAVLVALAAAAWAGLLFQSLAAAVVTFAVLVGAVGDFLFPLTFRLSREGAEARGPFSWRRILWADVKRVYAGEGEVKLSPLEHGGRREAFRGVLLRCADNQEAVLAAVRDCRDAVSPRWAVA